jgi:hydroxyacylglutathione hydrolase
MSIIKNDVIRIEKLTLGPYETNAYVLVCEKTKESLVVDAPARASEIISNLDGTVPKYILLTHDHYDHTGVIVSLRARLKIPLATHQESSYQLQKPPEILLRDGDSLKLGKLKIDVLFTPGHTPGSLCFKVDKYLFVGDTIFPGGPGHTDTPDDFRTIITSITEKIFRLPDDTLTLPGHGEGITIRDAKKEHAVFASRSHDEALFGDVTWQN